MTLSKIDEFPKVDDISCMGGQVERHREEGGVVFIGSDCLSLPPEVFRSTYLPTCLPTYLPFYLLTFPPTFPPTYLFLPTYLHT